jgi:FkbM family methyltransferase
MGEAITAKSTIQEKAAREEYIKLKIKKYIHKINNNNNNGIFKTCIFNYNFEYYDYSSILSLFYEIFICQLYEFKCKTDTPTIIDCGSNIGMSVLYFKKLYPESKIISFEPDQMSFNILRRNVSINNFTNVELHKIALCEKEGTIDFYNDTNNPGAVFASLNQLCTSNNVEQVQCSRLSSFINERINFLKLDIEGSENYVLKDLAETGKLNMIDEMIIEYHHHITPNKDYVSDILHILENNEYGYQICSYYKPPFKKYQFQVFFIYAYKKIL